MNWILLSMLQADAAAGAAAGAKGSSASMWIMLIALFAVMYFFMIRPQRKAQKEHQAYISSLKKGDKVVLQGGIYGKVVSVAETTIVVEIAKEVTVKVDKNSVSKDPSVAAAPTGDKKEDKKTSKKSAKADDTPKVEEAPKTEDAPKAE